MIRTVVAVIAAYRILVAQPVARRPEAHPASIEKPRSDDGDPAVLCEQLARSLRSGQSPSAAVDDCVGLNLPDGNGLRERIEGALSTTDDADRRLLLTVLATIVDGGGTGAETLDRCAFRLRVRAEDRREQRLASAPARLSAGVLTVLPIGVLVLLTATSEAVRTHLVSVTGFLGLVLGLGLNILGWRWMRRVLNRSPGGAELARLGELAEVLEISTMLVRAGIAPRVAVISAGRHAARPVRAHLTEFGWRLEHGWLTADALAALGDRIGPRGRRLIEGLVRAERYGSPLTPVLDRIIDDIDDVRREIAARRTRTLPIRLSAPLVMCTLPSFVLLAVIPAIGAALAGLGSGPLGDI